MKDITILRVWHTKSLLKLNAYAELCESGKLSTQKSEYGKHGGYHRWDYSFFSMSWTKFETGFAIQIVGLQLSTYVFYTDVI